MHISRETPTETAARLIRVFAESELVVFDRPYAFIESDVRSFPTHLLGDALAFVRDENVWSALVPSTSSDRERFFVFGVHFPTGADNSGFVGWLASRLKARLGTGVFVVCGQNSGRGGIFDYWGVPYSLSHQVLAEIESMRSGASTG